MKTPREILFQRHRAAEPKLDALTRGIVSSPAAATARRSLLSSLLLLPRNFWAEVIWPTRAFWMGITAVWAVILVADAGFRAETPRQTFAVSQSAATFVFAFREPEMWLLDFGTRKEPKDERLPKPEALPPRTERRSLRVII